MCHKGQKIAASSSSSKSYKKHDDAMGSGRVAPAPVEGITARVVQGSFSAKPGPHYRGHGFFARGLAR